MQLCRLLYVSLCLGAVGTMGQAPTGTIVGVVQDESGAVFPNALVTVSNKATGAARTVASSAAGAYSVSALQAGEYEVKAVADGFRTTVRAATVEVGATTTVELLLQVGASKDVVTVEAATAQVEYERHNVDGVITRQKIQELPLNGRSYLQLAFLEPGVTVSPGNTAQYNSLFSISVLGGDSGKTSISVDGGGIRNVVDGNSSMNFSQEVVQEFQLSSANFDLSTGITSVGAVNVVTRTGGNDFHGSGYFFFRDHNMAAYPALKRNAFSPDPFFARRNPGFWLGGPVMKDRLFFFFNLENMNQMQLFTVQPDLPSVAGLAINKGSPYHGKTLSARLDYRMSPNNALFLRYSHDGNNTFGPKSVTLPSNWLRNTNWSDQSVLGFTSSIRPTMVNDFRVNFTYWSNRNLFPRESDCPGCIGLGLPQVTLVGSSNFTIGNTQNATQGRDVRRVTLLDNFTWQKGSHRFRWGTDLEYAAGTGFWGFCDPGCVVAFSPEYVRSVVPTPYLALLFPNLPTTIKTNADVMSLPFAGGVIGIGDSSQPPPYNVDQAKANKHLRFYFQDTWRLTPRFTLNYGLAWSFETNLVNHDLTKPAYLAPLYGSDLSATGNNYKNWSPAVGFAYQADRSAKTVVRGGFGIYYDTEVLSNRLQERGLIGPVGNGRVQYPSSGFVNTIPGILNVGTLSPLAVGSPAPNGDGLYTMTVGQFLGLVGAQSPAIAAALAPKNSNDLTIRNINLAKSGSDLYPRDFPVQRGLHFSLGVQRQIRSDMAVTVDFVRRVYLNTLIDELDYNRFNRFINGKQSPVIPVCTGSQASDPAANCSRGPFTFWTPGGRDVYNAALVKFDKRFSRRYQFTASYALTNAHGYNGVYNMDQWNSSWGPQGARHILNLSGIVDLPFGFELGVISSSSSRGPVMAFVSGVDLTGSGVSTTPIPGVPFNSFNRGSGKAELAQAVANWNTTYAGKKDARGQTIPALQLPASYDFGRAFTSQDVRLTKKFTWRDRYTLSVFAEGFNIFNVANLSGYNFNLNDASTFGQPTQRVGQVFGSGGPRAFQLGGRFIF
ncbi:MAG: TonB-dependent receptor [Acidobacteria bacterium]|nr:TonB-dependent receptor [Acidobacteriota bacterium]